MACKRGHTHLIVFTHACHYYSRVATISLAELQVWLLFEGGYYSGCGFYSNKYGTWRVKAHMVAGGHSSVVTVPGAKAGDHEFDSQL